MDGNGSLLVGSQDGLSVRGYCSDGSMLLAFDLDPELTKNLAGFSIYCTPPSGKPYYLINRLNFGTPVTGQTTPEQRTFTTTDLAPIQKFRWMDFPGEGLAGAYSYQVTAHYFNPAGGLESGPSAQVQLELDNLRSGNLKIGFTRGYLSSQAYAARFQNAPIAPRPPTVDYDSSPFQRQYQWLGYHARELLFNFLQECLDDPSITVDLFAYDLDEPDFIRSLVKLGGRLRAVLDDSATHIAPGALEINARQLLVNSAGSANIKVGHFQRFSHSKVLIMKKNNLPVKVLTGSANFSVRGLYVQANNCLLFEDATTAGLYEQAFVAAFTNMSGFKKSSLAQGWTDVNVPGILPFSVCFSPHKDSNISLARVSQAIQNASSSVLFAVMELQGGGPVLQALQNMGGNNHLFSYGVTQSDSQLNLYRPGETHSLVVDFSYLAKNVPDSFRQEWSGGAGEVIHDKFVVVDFNGANPVLFTGSSNLSKGGEEENGDNLLAITDPRLVAAYAVEAVRLVDHYHFRVAMSQATDHAPLVLQGPGAATPWWQAYYDPNNIKYYDRLLFACGG